MGDTILISFNSVSTLQGVWHDAIYHHNLIFLFIFIDVGGVGEETRQIVWEFDLRQVMIDNDQTKHFLWLWNRNTLPPGRVVDRQLTWNDDKTQPRHQASQKSGNQSELKLQLRHINLGYHLNLDSPCKGITDLELGKVCW